MEKKNYTAPTLSVVEYDMMQIICSSNGNQVSSVTGNSGLEFGGAGTGGARANNRGGIWDED